MANKNADISAIQERVQIIRNALDKIGTIIDAAPLPAAVKKKLQKAIQDDAELQELIQGFENPRAPRLMLVGGTGVGKSSLLNAIYGTYAARVSDYKSCTSGTGIFEIENADGAESLVVLDTRGVGEGREMSDEAAEDVLQEDIIEFKPDLLILLLKAKDRGSARRDQAKLVQKLEETVTKHRMPKIPVLVVVNQCDAFATGRQKANGQYSEKTESKIAREISEVEESLQEWGLPNWPVIAVSSYMAWQTPDGDEVDNDDIAEMTLEEQAHLQILEDGRYGIDLLRSYMEKMIQDPKARAGLAFIAQGNAVLTRFADHLVNLFAGLAATVALSPIPLSDIAILSPLQILLVVLVGILGGQDLSWDSAKEFIVRAGGTVAVGFGLRLVGQQAVKLFNLLAPGAGSAASSAIAFGGTVVIGKAAINYYLKEEDMAEVQEQVREDKEKAATA